MLAVPINDTLEQPRRAHSAEPRTNGFRRSIGSPVKILSSSATLQREAEAKALHTFEGRPISPALELSGHIERNHYLSPSPPVASISAGRSRSASNPQVTSRPKAVLEQYEVFRAIDRKDLDLLGEIRDRAFRLLLERQIGGQTPMLYAMQYGKPHQEVVLFLVGAISQWINRLSDADFSKPVTITLLKLARANLKFAIDKGLSRLQTDLIASFLQTLVMCEGDQWIRDNILIVSFALKAGPAGKPVDAAYSAVERFCTHSLLNADLIADVEDYMANATVDLLMMAAWSNALTRIDGQMIPLYYFARDDRVYNAFVEKLEQYKDAISTLLNRLLRRQLDALKTELQGRARSPRGKIENLRHRLEKDVRKVHDLLS